MGFYFFPRGGSAQVVRYLCRSLPAAGWHPRLFSGSMGGDDDESNASRFFAGIPCTTLDYSAARAEWLEGRDPMAAPVPMHASFEDKPNVPDRSFLALDTRAFGRQEEAWTRLLSENRSPKPSVLHLHHLTPLNEAAMAVWPTVPIVSHLHGTELKMLTSVARNPSDRGGRAAELWTIRLRRWAQASSRLIVLSQQDEDLALELLSVDPDRIVRIGNGVDTSTFFPREPPLEARLESWRRWLVEDPLGWRPGQGPGSIRYGDEDLAAFVEPDGSLCPVVLFVGRFMSFKRVGLLIEAHRLAARLTGRRTVLVIAGGFPGEWEGEHPWDTAQRLRAADVFFLGWRGHDQLPDILACSDIFAAPSVDEPFGLVFLEAMASGVPPLATTTGGPVSFINVDDGAPTGWLVPPDDVAATARALSDAVTDPTARHDRGARAARFVDEHYGWAATARLFARVYDDAVQVAG